MLGQLELRRYMVLGKFLLRLQIWGWVLMFWAISPAMFSKSLIISRAKLIGKGN